VSLFAELERAIVRNSQLSPSVGTTPRRGVEPGDENHGPGSSRAMLGVSAFQQPQAHGSPLGGQFTLRTQRTQRARRALPLTGGGEPAFVPRQGSRLSTVLDPAGSMPAPPVPDTVRPTTVGEQPRCGIHREPAALPLLWTGGGRVAAILALAWRDLCQ
jgi:hypothetical protein